MRRTASEVLRTLEVRIARLEKRSARTFKLFASYHSVYQPRDRDLADQDWHSKTLFEGPKKQFIPSKRPEHSMVEKFVEGDVIREIGKIQKEIEGVFHSTGFDPTESWSTFDSSGNKFEWVMVANREPNEVLKLAYVRTTDKTFNFYIAPAINIEVLNSSDRETKAPYLLNHLASELGMRTVRV